MSTIREAFDAGRNAVRNRRTAMLSVCALMAIDAMIEEFRAHNYVSVLLAAIFFLIVMPWLGWAWIKPPDRNPGKHGG